MHNSYKHNYYKQKQYQHNMKDINNSMALDSKN